jgi:hypothetical protein
LCIGEGHEGGSAYSDAESSHLECLLKNERVLMMDAMKIRIDKSALYVLKNGQQFGGLMDSGNRSFAPLAENS